MMEAMAKHEAWLNGWHRIGHSGVLYGTAVCCAGCGKVEGITCVAIPADWTPPPEPNWPFDEATCPVHNRPPDPEPQHINFDTWPPRVADLYVRAHNAERELAALKAKAT